MNKRDRTLVLILIPALFSLFVGSARADMTVEFSDAVGAAANAETRQQIQDLVNAGLRERAKNNNAAKDLLGSNQTIKLICNDEQKAKDEKIDFEVGLFPEFGKTKGDFDDKGKPKSGGTVYIAINCDFLRQFGWHTLINALGTEQSMWDVLVHELLHATNSERRHPPDDTAIYDQWVKDFNAGIAKELKTAATKAKEKKVSLVPRTATDVYVAVNNQPQTLACFAGELSDQDAQELKQQLSYEVVAKTPTGTLIRSPQSAQTIELIANGRRIKLCFPPEVDVCLIMTPLTPFRGHDHATHQGGAHEHRPSDLPPDWGVTPPETIIRW
jgi:hypothetical protein